MDFRGKSATNGKEIEGNGRSNKHRRKSAPGAVHFGRQIDYGLNFLPQELFQNCELRIEGAPKWHSRHSRHQKGTQQTAGDVSRLRKDTPRLRKDTPRLWKDTPRLRKDTPRLWKIPLEVDFGMRPGAKNITKTGPGRNNASEGSSGTLFRQFVSPSSFGVTGSADFWRPRSQKCCSHYSGSTISRKLPFLKNY